MKIYIMTDLEGVAGVLDSEHWCDPGAPYYELAKEMLTMEVNAAIEGFSAAGAGEFLVADGHGCGAINPLLLDSRAELLRGFSNGYPYELDRTFDAIAWIGQHAMSRTPYAHLPHTGSMRKLEYSINGVAVGEFGQLSMCASELGVRSIFGSGDLAFCKEAKALVSGIETVAVKRGITPGSGDECDTEQYAKRNTAAIHLHPARARELIRKGSERAIQRFHMESFGLIPLKAPFEMIKEFREFDGQPRMMIKGSHPSSVIEMLRTIPVEPPVKTIQLGKARGQ